MRLHWSGRFARSRRAVLPSLVAARQRDRDGVTPICPQAPSVSSELTPGKTIAEVPRRVPRDPRTHRHLRDRHAAAVVRRADRSSHRPGSLHRPRRHRVRPSGDHDGLAADRDRATHPGGLPDVGGDRSGGRRADHDRVQYRDGSGIRGVVDRGRAGDVRRSGLGREPDDPHHPSDGELACRYLPHRDRATRGARPDGPTTHHAGAIGLPDACSGDGGDRGQ